MNHLHSRLGRVEKRPAKTRLKSNIVSSKNMAFKAITKESIAKEAVTPEEVSFGVNLVTDTLPIENLKEGTTVTDPVTGGQQVYSASDDTWTPVSDPVAIFDAATAAATAAAAAAAALAAQTTADGKNKIYRQTTEPTGGTYAAGDLWFDTANDNRMSRYAAAVSLTVSNKALTSNVATLTTTAAHGMSAGYSVTVSGVDATFNGTFTVTGAPTVTTFTYALVSANVSSTASSGTVTSPVGWYQAKFSTNALGVIDASVVNVSNLNAGNISTGYLAAARIAAGSLDASVITAGTITATQINAGYVYAGSIAANQITAGTISATISLTAATVIAGAIKIGNNVDGGTEDGVYLDSNNYWYGTGSFKVGNGTEYLSFSGGNLIVTGEINATSGTFTGSITGSSVIGSSFQTTNYGVGVGTGMLISGSTSSILFTVTGTSRGSITQVGSGLVINGGYGATLTLTTAGNASLATAGNYLSISDDGSVNLQYSNPSGLGLRNSVILTSGAFNPASYTPANPGDIVYTY